MTTPNTTFAGLALIAALCAGFTLGLTAPAWAGLDEGVAAYKRGDYATALREWRPLAKQGYANAQFFFGFMYYNGQGVPQDYAKTLQWWRKAAEQGYAKAQYNLGVMYRKGQGVPQDYAKALQWWRKAAEQGDANAQFNLGVMYRKGQGVPRDDAEAAKWYRKAADQGDAVAQNNIGLMYDNGRGVPQDYGEAVKWYRKAADQGDAVAQNNIGLMYENGRGVPRDYGEAVKWYRRAAEAGLAEAQYTMGRMRHLGVVLVRDDRRALAWYHRAAAQGHPKAKDHVKALDAAGVTPLPTIAMCHWLRLSFFGGARSFFRPRRAPHIQTSGKIARNQSAIQPSTSAQSSSSFQIWRIRPQRKVTIASHIPRNRRYLYDSRRNPWRRWPRPGTSQSSGVVFFMRDAPSGPQPRTRCPRAGCPRRP